VSLAQLLAAQRRADADVRAGFDWHLELRHRHTARTPGAVEGQAFFTPEEAAQWERQVAENNQEPPTQTPSRNTGTGTYNTFYREFGTRTVKTLRTSIVTIHPMDGFLPSHPKRLR
jgi:hypothetical protein